MSKPARIAAVICSAAVLFAACTMKKAEVVPDAERDTTAISSPEPIPPKPPVAAGERRAQDKSEVSATGTQAGSPGKGSLMDRLYPNEPRTASTLAGSREEKKTKPANKVLKDQETTGWLDNPSAVYILDNSSDGSMSLPEIAQGASRNQPTPAAKRAAPASAPSVAPREISRHSAQRLMKSHDAPMHEEEGYGHDRDCYRCPPPPTHRHNSEEYASIYENAFLAAKENPLSTFSIDVDGAAYSNTRRFIQEGRLPPADAVRIEEFINYFDYNYPQPSGSDPFSITTEVAATPWNPETKLVHIGLQGRRMENEKLPPNNLVFLIDVSGSMATPDKLPLLKNSFDMLIDQLRPQDRISMVVYAGAAGMVLPPTSGSEKETIREALGRLDAGGSTAGGAGLMLAYHAARQSFIKGGSNRVILATDGDFNVGVSSNDELIRLIEEKRKTGVFLSVLGFGTGNLKDAKMEQIADKGNGNYFYIDNINEGRKVLVEKMTGTLYAIAKDVKLQIEFNPALVKSYRLVGYENRMLAAEDFNDDRKDAGELGAGANVTALYEIVPAAPKRPDVDPLKYQDNGASRRSWNWGGRNDADGELLTVKFRYKQPNGSTSKLLSRTLRSRDAAWQDASENFRFSAAAAGFGLLLRGSQYSGDLDLDKVASMARGARGKDIAGHRAEFITLVESAKPMYGGGQVGYRYNRE